MATVLESVSSSESTTSSVYRSAAPVVSFEEAAALAGQFGTPLLVASRAALLRNYEALRSALPGVEFFYAAKANPSEAILRPLCEIGSSVDVCSPGEMRAALAAGFTPEMMIHTHPCKTEHNLTSCYAQGLRWFTFDNVNEIPKLARHAPDASLLVRLAVSSSSSLINLSAKFGAFEPDAVPLMLAARDAGLAVRGMSFHVGSQCRSPEDFHTALVQARRIWNGAADAGIPLEVLDIGGGIPAPYRDSVLTLDVYCRSLARALDETFGDLNVRIIAEPGRGLVADTMTLVTRVIGKSQRAGTTWYIIDDGLYGSFSGQMFDHVEYPLVANGDDRELMPCVVAGPTCDSSDVVSRDQALPDLDVGELLLAPTMGAYTCASASNFNGLDLARIIPIE
ncbi:MAG TPA: type III PLP-dependent enzyme [Planctomycetaceae bacterium]|nr:type III PLP-dependent enzyme [Planctomycetaceae bacterium]